MNLCLDKILEVYPDFNEREHTTDDFWKVAATRKIKVKEEPLLIKGYYKVKKDKPIILININLAPIDWLVTAFHETIHDILDVKYKKTSVLLYRDVQKLESIQEQRAEDIALILVIPLKKLKELENTPFDLIHPFTQDLLIKRKRVYEKHGI